MLQDEISKRFREKVIELVDVGAQNLWMHFKDGILYTCDEVCGKKMGWGIKGDTWWWNVEVKDAISRKKDTQKTMCQNSTENRNRYESIKNKVKKAVSKAMRVKAEEVLLEVEKLSKWNV